MQRLCGRHRFILGFLGLGLLAGTAMITNPAQAASGVGPFLPEPSWDRKIPTAARFLILTNWNSEAVLDKETGLVWERSPSNIGTPWGFAQGVCTAVTKGNRKGWRLPSVHELASLVDPSLANVVSPTLPVGHPFLNVLSSVGYWSATTTGFDSTFAWQYHFGIAGAVRVAKITDFQPAWCVRGGVGVNAEVY